MRPNLLKTSGCKCMIEKGFVRFLACALPGYASIVTMHYTLSLGVNTKSTKARHI